MNEDTIRQRIEMERAQTDRARREFTCAIKLPLAKQHLGERSE